MKRKTWIILAVFASSAAVSLVAMLQRPSITPDRETPWRVICASHLKQIGTGIQLYARDHGGSLPDSFATVLRTEDLTPDLFVCPTDGAVAAESVAVFKGTPADCSYVYLGDGLTSDAAADVIVAMDRLDNHDHDGINILFGDGHTDFIQIGLRNKPTPAWWLEIEDQIVKHVRPIRLPPEPRPRGK
jgi:prepilin-type processing-associated H-X9-DG protein